MVRNSPSNAHRQDGKVACHIFLNHFVSVEFFDVPPKAFMLLLKSAIIAWEFIVAQIALCKSPFNVTFFSFHRTGMSHQKGRLKFHYQGGFGHVLKVKAWQQPAKMSPKIKRLTRITKYAKIRYFYEKGQHYIHETFCQLIKEICPTAVFSPLGKLCIC